LTDNQPNPAVWIRTLTFSDGTSVSLAQDDIVVLVGPNNAGKSAALRNIEQLAEIADAPTAVVTAVELDTQGDLNTLQAWLDRNSRKSMLYPPNPSYQMLGARVTAAEVSRLWDHAKSLGDLSDFFVYMLTTEGRLTAANPAPNIALTTDPLTHPIHYMQIDDEIEERISSYFREAFGEDLILNRNAGNQVPLHCGQRPVPRAGEDRVSVSYIRELEKLPALHTQGDGMRGFVGVILHSLAMHHTVILIDEPEAFLHPPQARLLGQMIAKDAPRGRQFFLSTHSGDFLRGLLDVQSNRVRVIRVQREGLVNPVKELDSRGVKRVWGDPILRYSNVLDGLFHSKVILCESDGDCRFYAALMDAMRDSDSETRRQHVMFMHCGGKAKMPTVVDALRNLDVPVRVVVDFDILNDEQPLRRIVEALGGDWSALGAKWRVVKQAIDSKKPELSTDEVLKEISAVTASITTTVFPPDAKRSIQGILRRSTPWSVAKSVGKAFIPSGDSTIAFEELTELLVLLGLYVVPIGELEGFGRSVAGHGPRWVNEVLQKNLAGDPELEEARSFVRSFLS
jgi:Predicted ATP-dependent endonuclease of the OLD family